MKRKWLKYERETRLAGFLIVTILLVMNIATVFMLNNTRDHYKLQLKLRLDFAADIASRQLLGIDPVNNDAARERIREIADYSGFKEIGIIDDKGTWKFSTSAYRMQFSKGPTERPFIFPQISDNKLGRLGKPYKLGNSSYIDYIYGKKINQSHLIIIAPADYLSALETAEWVLNFSLLIIGGLVFVFLYFYLRNIFSPFQKMAQSAKNELCDKGIVFDSDVELVMDTYHKMIGELKEKGKKLGELYGLEKIRADNLEHYSRQVLDNIDKGIITLGNKGSIISFNKAATIILGEDGIREINNLISTIDFGQAVTKEIEGVGGRKIIIQVEVSRFKELGGKNVGHIIVVSDITEARRLEELAGYSERSDLINSSAQNLLTKISPILEELKDNISETAADKKIYANLSAIESCLNEYGRIFSLEKTAPSDKCSTDIIYRSDAMKNVLQLAAKVAGTDSNVLIAGESGTGKELIAKEIHRMSSRANGPFIALNCAALPETLLESELFGYVKGAFTGASRDKPGLFRIAEQGSFFLDEVSELSLALQAKILRVIQEREIVPVGGTKPGKVDVRLIAATNQKLEELVAKGLFRQDLFYRLNVFPILIPALRERSDDIEPLVNHFIAKYSLKQRKQVTGINAAALKIMTNQNWPGNVRQLENAVERAVIMAGGHHLEPKDIEFLISQIIGQDTDCEGIEGGLLAVSGRAAAEAESGLIKKVLGEVNGNKSEAARRLKISYRVMLKKIKDYGLK
ncbi:MAG: sigma 54-interacting transcriptional regulator [Candidatus Edwardsbacteria bacterium]|nr:sigma 54-interacting transcriptional regulator [Candidatus Edwardsbacteria bacterium]